MSACISISIYSETEQRYTDVIELVFRGADDQEIRTISRLLDENLSHVTLNGTTNSADIILADDEDTEA